MLQTMCSLPKNEERDDGFDEQASSVSQTICCKLLYFFGRGMIIIQNTPQQLVLIPRLLPSLVNTCTPGLCNNTLRALCVCVYLLLQLNPPNPASHFDAHDWPAGTVARCETSVRGDPQANRLQSLPPNPGMHLHVLPPHTPLFKQP